MPVFICITLYFIKMAIGASPAAHFKLRSINQTRRRTCFTLYNLF